jgi:hypothetical protein
MRPDMAKVICERERVPDFGCPERGQWSKGKRNDIRFRNAEDAEEPWDELPTKESMRNHRFRNGVKQLNENLSPLRRYLEKQVGRPWDKVQSEVIKTCGNENAVQRHVMQHVRSYVEEQMVDVGGVLHQRVHHRFASNPGGLVPLKESSADLYVDPRTRLLCRNKWLKRQRKRSSKAYRERKATELAKTQRVIDGHSYVKRGGLWFESWVEKRETLEPPPNVLREVRSGARWVTREVPRYRIVPTKELRRLGLVNEAAA